MKNRQMFRRSILSMRVVRLEGSSGKSFESKIFENGGGPPVSVCYKLAYNSTAYADIKRSRVRKYFPIR